MDSTKKGVLDAHEAFFHIFVLSYKKFDFCQNIAEVF